MAPQNKIENVSDGDKGAGSDRPADNLTGSRTVDGKTVQAMQRTNPNFRSSMSDIPNLGALGKSGSNTGFAITDGDQVIASKTVQGVPATEGNPQEPVSETTYPSGIVINQHGKLLLQTGISNVPEVSQGIQNLDDLEALANGLATGVSNVVGDTLTYLSKPNAVSDSLISIGPALDTAVNYYANTPPDKVLAEAQDALGYVGRALEDTLGHPLTPEQRGQRSGEAMAMMFPWGIRNAEVSEKFPQLLAAAENTTPEFRAALEEAVTEIPADVRDFLEQNETKIVGLRRLSEVAADAPGDLHGIYRPAENRIYIPEEVMNKEGRWVKNDSIAFSARHEAGHVANLQLGSRPISETETFVDAYKADFAKLTPEKIDRLEQFGKNNKAAREELFCEIFALKTGAAPKPEYEEFIRESFPTVYKLLGD